jgi:RNA polymerase sigma-70 factor (ECF subfamily)
MEVLDLRFINDNYKRQLSDVAYQIVKDCELTKDVIQDSFVKIWKNQHKFDESKGALFTWMRNIVVRTAIDAARTKFFKTSREEMPKHISSSYNCGKIDVGNMDVKTILNSIEFKYAFVIEKIVIEGFSERQLAKEYGMPLGTVKTRKQIGLRELRKLYKS